jgi:hypothetical protein
MWIFPRGLWGLSASPEDNILDFRPPGKYIDDSIRKGDCAITNNRSAHLASIVNPANTLRLQQRPPCLQMHNAA